MSGFYFKRFSSSSLIKAKTLFATHSSATMKLSAKYRFIASLATAEANATRLVIPEILREIKDRASIITINRPKYLNAFNEDMAEALYEAFKATQGDQNIDLMIMKGNGKVFSAGGDVQAFANGASDPSKYTQLNVGLDYFYRGLYKISELEQPSVAFLDGLTVGVSVGYTSGARFRVATENTALLMPEITIGHFCDGSTSYYLSRLDGHYGRYLTLCRPRINAHDVMMAGIATHFVSSSRLPSLEEHLINLKSPDAKTVSQEINKFTTDFSNSSTFDSPAYEKKRRIINDCFKFDTVEEILAALEKEGSEFSLTAMGELLKGSPQAVKLTLELLRQARNLSLKECVLLERQLWRVDMASHDFLEGCQSMLQKRKPVWSPKHLSDLDLERDIRTKFFGKAKSYNPIELDV